MSTSVFGWTPLFSSIIDSSVWRQSKETRLVWITILAKKNKSGYVRAALWALARDAGVTEDECREAIRVLESPDPDSHCKEHEGRRIKPVDGGWVVLNHFLYRDLISKENQRRKQAEWAARDRAAKKAKKVGPTARETAFVEAHEAGDEERCDAIAAMTSNSQL